MGSSAEEGLEVAGEVGEAGPEDVDERVGADDCDCAELIDCAGVRDFAAEVGEVLEGRVGLLAEPDGVVPGEQQVDGFLVVGRSTERK